MYITALTLSTMFLTFSSVEFMVICPCNHPANYCRDFSAANYPLMISFLLDIDWLMLQQSCSVDEFWNVFSMKLNECIERLFLEELCHLANYHV